MRRNGTLALAAVVLLFTASSCRKKPATVPAPLPSTSAADRERIRLDSIQAAEEARQAADRARQQNMEQQQQSTRSVQTTMGAPIYFELDDADITPEAVSVLDAKIAIMRRELSMRVRVTGHTDERGSDEYNVALGMRRAAEAKRFMIDRGIPGSRIDIATRGEEEPAVRGQDETAWSRNRRAEFVIVSR